MARTFVWADLSTFDLKAASEFYGQCFDWDCQSLSDEYRLLLAGVDSVGGMYTMPEQFQSVGMPSFWMSYIHVNDIQQTVRVAVEHGAKVEIPPQPAHGGGLIALIRDPAGAGFTCYEGDDPGSNDQSGRHGHIVWNELHVSDLAKIKPFYCSVFGWDIRPCEDTNRFLIFDSTSATNAIAGIQVTGNHIKGDKEYWGVYIRVKNRGTTSKIVLQHGGEIVAEQPLGNQPALLANDPQGAAFYVIEGTSGSRTSGNTPVVEEIRWRALSGLAIVVAAIITENNWIWGLLFLFWVIPDVKRGSTHFIEHVERHRNPYVYWLIISVWVVSSLFLLFEGFF